MARKGPYPHHPPSQFRTPPFYFRGGDVLREREYLLDEYKMAAADFRRAEYELDAIEHELQASIDTLHEREGYTNALASFLDADTDGNLAEQDVKRRLPRVESEIRKAELDLADARAVHLPAVAGALQKEKAYLLIELKRTQEALDQTHEQQTFMSRKLARTLSSPKYQASLDFETKVLDLNRKTTFLRNLVDRSKKDFDRTRPTIPLQTEDARAERAALGKQLDAIHMLERSREKATRRVPKWVSQINRLLFELEDLNRVITDVGMTEAELLDIDAIRSKYKDGEGDQEDGQEPAEPVAETPES
jgi:hypothetical protein